MTARQRLIELRWFLEGDGQYTEVPFGDIHQRIEALMQRPVWTHELGTNGAKHLVTELEQEARNVAIG
jgi:hypothetical protein